MMHHSALDETRGSRQLFGLSVSDDITPSYLLTGLCGADAAHLQHPHCRCDGPSIVAGPQGHQHRDGRLLYHS